MNMFQKILNYSNLHSQISILLINRYTYNNLYIKKLISRKIEQKYIMQHKFKKLEILCVYDNSYINDVNHLSDTLIELNCGGYINGITQSGISKLKKIKYLNIYDNSKIKCIENMNTTLEGLNCGGMSSISQKDIMRLVNLKFLNMYENDKINNVDHLAENLIGLNCGSFYPGRMKLCQSTVNKLNKLEFLFAENNENILHHNINNIKVNNRDCVHSTIMCIDTLDIYIRNDISHRKRFDKLKKQVIELYIKN